MKIVIASDHGGFEAKEFLKEELKKDGIELVDFGTFSSESVDYPAIGIKAAEAVARGEFDRGILICGTGIGISIAANKVKGIRAAHCTDPLSAKLTRWHNDANMIALGGRIVGLELNLEIVRCFLNEEHQGGRHKNRVDQIKEYENKVYK